MKIMKNTKTMGQKWTRWMVYLMGICLVMALGMLPGYAVGAVSDSQPLAISGFQISTTQNGVRTVYSVKKQVNHQQVTEQGLIYALADYTQESQLFMEQTGTYVRAYPATENGVISSDEETTDYAMTLTFGGESIRALTQKYFVKPYAKLEDGTYIYGAVQTYSAADIAAYLYEQSKMPSIAQHQYLYDRILSVVDSTYPQVAYQLEQSTGNFDFSQLCGTSEFCTRMRQVLSEQVLETVGQEYYVSPNTSSSQEDGTKTHPFHSLKKAVSVLKKGDTLYLLGGTYRETLHLSKLQGAENAYITIQAAPGETVVLDGKGLGSSSLIQFDACAYIQIAGLELANLDGMDVCGISVTAGNHHLVIKDNRIHDITVPNPTQEDHCANGMLLMGDNADQSIHDVLIYRNTLENCATGWSECISVTGHTEYINVIANIISNTGNIGIDFTGNYGYCSDPAKDFPVHCLAYKNVVTDCVSGYATSYGLYVDGGQDISFLENRIERCSGGIEIGAEEPQKSETYATAQIRVSHNEIWDCLEAAITIGGYEEKLGWVKDVTVEHNICLDNGLDFEDGAILTLSKCKNITLRENTFVNTKGSTLIVASPMSKTYTTGIVFERNIYGNGNAQNKTQFQFQGKAYSKFADWEKAVDEKNGTYQSEKK